MILKTKELAKVYYEVEYALDEKKMTQKEKEILKNKKDIETIRKIISKSVIDESAEQDPDAFDFKIESIEDVDFEEED